MRRWEETHELLTARGLQPVIGLEVHVQLACRSKLFCGCPTTFGAAPNTQVCPICSGQPGTLPTLNGRAVILAVRLARALGATLADESRFARKSYFYPDLPKGYQITQHDQPLAKGGALRFRHEGRVETLPLTRLHLEEDAGKTQHLGDVSAIDLDRAGIPLVELVSEPALSSPAEAGAALRELRAIVRALGISDGNLEQGSLRCDANVSLRPVEQTALGTRCELKNLNSFRFVERALAFELTRQAECLLRGEAVQQETRLWNDAEKRSEPLRSKEEADDYRYFPEPDLPPLRLTEDRARFANEVAAELAVELRATAPELPLARSQRLEREHGLSAAQAEQLCRNGELADYFEGMVAAGSDAHLAATWSLGELLEQLSDPRRAAEAAISPEQSAELLQLVSEGALTRRQARSLWPELWVAGGSPRELAQKRDLAVLRDPAQLLPLIAQILAAHPSQIAHYQAGKTQLLAFFIGQVQHTVGGRAAPDVLKKLLVEELDALTVWQRNSVESSDP